MAVKETLRIKLKSYDHTLIDQALRKRSWRPLREAALPFPVPTRSPPKRRSSPFSAPSTSIRTARTV